MSNVLKFSDSDMRKELDFNKIKSINRSWKDKPFLLIQQEFTEKQNKNYIQEQNQQQNYIQS